MSLFVFIATAHSAEREATSGEAATGVMASVRVADARIAAGAAPVVKARHPGRHAPASSIKHVNGVSILATSWAPIWAIFGGIDETETAGAPEKLGG